MSFNGMDLIIVIFSQRTQGLCLIIPIDPDALSP